MSLMKYTIFINSLLVNLKNAEICCKLYTTPSTPLGYADDVATACLSKNKLDQAMDIVHSHGCAWRYDFNTKKSGVLVYGEKQQDHTRNSKDRIFKLGTDRVKERCFYDHVGIRNTIFESDISGIEERISKGRRAFNAVTGIGIRKGGLTMSTCNMIIWTIVVPTTIYGCEMWIIDDSSLSLLENFQNHVGKKIQRLHPKCPNICSFYGLGWMRLERIIQIKKIMFVRSVMVMMDDALPKILFCQRAQVYFLNQEYAKVNPHRSNVFDLLNVCDIFGFLDDIKRMIEKNHFYPKTMWKEKTWKRAWELEDVYWRIERLLHRNLDLLVNVSNETKYLRWWKLSDKFPEHVKKCETLSKMLCHSSNLRNDDCKLKGETRTHKLCTLCDNYAVEDVRHIVLQCPYFDVERNSMFEDIYNLGTQVSNALRDSPRDMLYTP